MRRERDKRGKRRRVRGRGREKKAQNREGGSEVKEKTRKRNSHRK